MHLSWCTREIEASRQAASEASSTCGTQVFKAVLDGSTIVAVKFVQGQSSKEQQRFEREVAILKGLRHTNIVQFLGASIVHGQIMLVTE